MSDIELCVNRTTLRPCIEPKYPESCSYIWQTKVYILLCFQNCTKAIRVHPPRTCSSFKNHFSAPNHRTDTNLFVYDLNTSKNEWNFFQVCFIIKNWQKKYKKRVWIVCSKQDWSKKT